MKIFAFGQFPEGSRNRFGFDGGGIELYDGKRFFAFTGNRLDESPLHVHHREPELLLIHRRLEEDRLRREAVLRPPPAVAATRSDRRPGNLDDARILELAGNAKNGPKFLRLKSGDWSGYQSHSEAELALASILAFWIGPDMNRIADMLGHSGLSRARSKFNRPDYLTRTIKRAVASCPIFYSLAMTGGGSDISEITENYSEFTIDAIADAKSFELPKFAKCDLIW